MIINKYGCRTSLADSKDRPRKFKIKIAEQEITELQFIHVFKKKSMLSQIIKNQKQRKKSIWKFSLSLVKQYF